MERALSGRCVAICGIVGQGSGGGEESSPTGAVKKHRTTAPHDACNIMQSIRLSCVSGRDKAR